VTGTLPRKLVRDLAAIRGRIVLMGVAVGVSLTVFGATLYAGTITAREFDRGYLSTNPASATLLLDKGVSPDRAAELSAATEKRPGVAAATMRTQFTAQFRPNGGQWSDKPLQVFVAAPDDPMRLAKFELDRGTWPPPPDGILIERAALKFLDLEVGDPLTVKTPDGRPVTLTITGVVHDPSLAEARQEQKGYGYVSTASLPTLGAPTTLNQLKVATTDTTSRESVATIGRDLAAWLSSVKGTPVTEIQVPEPGRHPHRQWVDLILRILFVFGGTLLLLSALLVATMLNRLISQQIPQIGIMKAIGARARVVRRQYLTMVFVVATGATVVAVVPGFLLGRQLARMLLTMQDMDPTSLTVPWWTYAAVGVLGLFLAPLLALIPITRASHTTVREAIDHHGAGTGEVRTPNWVSRIRGLDRALLMGLRNMFRRRARFVLLVGLLTAAGALFLGGANTLTGLYAFQAQAAAQQTWDAEIDLAGFGDTKEIKDVVTTLPGVAGVETWSMVSMTVARDAGQVEVTGTYPDQGHGTRFLAAVPANTTMVDPPLETGRWLHPGDIDAIVLNRGTAGGLLPDAKVGDTVTLTVDGRRTTWQVAGFVRQMFAGPSAFVTTEGFAAATGHKGHANRVEITGDDHSAASQSAIAEEARTALVKAGVAVQVAMPAGRLAGVIDGHVYAAGWTLLMIAIVIAIVGYIGMASTMSTSVLERIREFGIMHAIGAPPSTVRRTVAAEGLFTALASCLLAIPLALAIATALNHMIGNMIAGDPLPMRISWPANAIWLAALLAGALLATLAPARRASRLTVREALTYL
jgi:putative ABC transport system permease protein